MHEIEIKGVEDIIEVQNLIHTLGVSQIHGQLLVDKKGEGVLIMGVAGTGKSRLTSELLGRYPSYKFIADDFLCIKVIDGKLYGTHHPLKPNLHHGIIYNSDPDDLYTEKKRQELSDTQIYDRPVKISTVFFIGNQNEDPDVVVQAEVQDLEKLNNSISQNIASLSESPQSRITDNSLVFTRYDINNRETSILTEITEKMMSVLLGNI